MKRSLATFMILVLALASILPGVPPASLDVASARAPASLTPPVPTQLPSGSDAEAQPLPTPPSVDKLPPELEEARAREAIEAVLEKHLHYWGPRFEVAPVEVAVEGEWAYGVARWSGEARTLEGPIHILARRLPEGIWQALMPSAEGLYLQWVDAVPESLVPTDEKGELSIQAAEAEAQRWPQASPAVPAAPTAMPRDRERPSVTVKSMPGPANNAAPPTPQATPVVPQLKEPKYPYVRDGDIWITDRTGQAHHQLTSGGHDSNPVLSPDGRIVAYLSLSSRYLGSAPAPQDVCIIDMLTIDSTCLTDKPALRGNPVWSPNGSKLAYVEDRELVLASLDGNERRVIVTNVAVEGPLFATPAWSPNGDALACVLDDGEGSAVWLIDPSAGPRRRLMDMEHYISTPLEFSPNGSSVTFVNMFDEGRLWTIPLDGSGATRLVEEPTSVYDFSWSPTGDRMALSRTDGSVWILDPRVEAENKVSIGTFQGLPSRVAWFDGNEKILLTVPTLSGTALIVLSPNSSEEFQIISPSFDGQFTPEEALSPLGEVPAPFEWYRYQGESDSGSCASNNCGPTAVAMAIQFAHNNQWVSISEIRTYISGTDCRWTNLTDLRSALSHWGVEHTTIAGMDAVRDAVNSRGHIVIVPVWMSYIPAGSDYLSSYSDPASHYNRYHSYTSGHFVVVRGISGDNNWVIIHDPNVWDGNGIYWYSDYTAKGRNRYYSYSNFASAFANNGNQAIEILEVPEDIDITDPDGEITSPNEDAIIESCTVWVGGWGSDSQSGFNHAHFTADYGSGWRQISPDFTSSPFGFYWDMCNDDVPNGPVTIGLDIWDNAGNEANSPRGVRHFTKSYTPPCNPPSKPGKIYPDLSDNVYPEDDLIFYWLGDASEYRVHWWGGTGVDITSDWMSGTSWNVGQQWESPNEYHWQVQGRNGANCEGPWSDTSNFIISPKAPTNLNVSAVSHNQLNLSWQDNSTTESDYHIERAPDLFAWEQIDTVSASSYEDTGLTADTTYYYRVRAHRHNDGRYSKYSNTDNDTTPPCAFSDPPPLVTPPDGAELPHDADITLDWGESSGASEYYARLWGGSGVDSNSGWIPGTEWHVGSLAPGTYFWDVKARNECGESDPSGPWSFTVQNQGPDLVPYQGAGWDYPVVPSSVTGTHTVNTLYAGFPTYIDWGVTNVGDTDIDGSFWMDLYFDDNPSFIHHEVLSLGAGASSAEVDWDETFLSAGWHTLKIVVDAGDDIAESDETNNVWEHEFYWTCPDPYEENDSWVSATPIEYGQTLEGAYICPPGDVDYYVITGEAGDWIVADIDAQVLGSELDSVIHLFDSDGVTLLAWNDDYGGSLDSQLTASLPHDGTYYLRVEDFSDAGGPNHFYTITLVGAKLTVPFFDRMEQGTNGWTAAGFWHQVDQYSSPYPEANSPIRSWWYGQDTTGNYDDGAHNHGELTSPALYVAGMGYYLHFWYWYETESLATEWDQRWVRISANGGPFNNVVQLSGDPMQTWLAGPAIDLTPYTGQIIQVQFAFDTVDNVQNLYRGWYIDDFSISTDPPVTCGDGNEPNNTANFATPIVYSQTLTADICPYGDVDFYTFNGLTGDRIVIDIDAADAGSALDSYIYLIDSDRSTVLAQHDDEYYSLDSHLSYSLPHDGTYYIKVRNFGHPYGGGPDYFYDIRVLNDKVSPTAEIISPNHYTWLDPNLQTITTNVSDNESGIRNVTFYWHDAIWDGSSGWSSWPDWDPRDGWTYELDTSGIPEQPQDCVVFVYAYDWAGNYAGYGSYHLGIDRTSPTVTAGVEQMYGDAPFRDFWVNWWNGADNLSGIASYDVQYRDGADGTWTDLPIGTTDIFSTRFVGVEDHTYYFRARALDYAGNQSAYAGGDGDVQHTVTICAIPPDAYENDDIFGNAPWIATDGTLQIHNIHVEEDQDWVKFEATDGITYTLVTTNTGGHADTVLYLYDTDGSTLIDSNDDYPGMWPSSRLDWQPSASGVYYAMVEHWDPWAYGCTTEYGLSISSLQPPDVSIHQSLLSGITEPDATLTYRLEYLNLGNLPASNVWITDSLPAEVSYVNSTGPVPPIIEGQVVRWDLGSLDPGASGEISITVHIPDGVPIGTWLNNEVQISTTDAETETTGSGLEGNFYQYDPDVIGVPPDDPFANGILKLRRTDPTVDFFWYSASPQPGVLHTEYFAVRWTGYVYAPQSGLYTFATVTDDGARLWVNGSQLVDDWTQHGMETRTGQIELEAEQWYPIQFDFEEGNWDAGAQLMWQGPGEADLTVIPQQYLSPQSTAMNNQSELGFRVRPPLKTSDLLLVLDYGGYDTDWFRSYFINALDELGYAYDVWDTEIQGPPDDNTLLQYVDGAVVWTAPYWGYVIYNGTFNALQSYLDAGGGLFLTSQDTGFYLNDWGNTAFLNGYLHADFVQSDTDLLTLLGTPGDPIGDGRDLSLAGGDGAGNQGTPDEIDPLSPAVTVFAYDETGGIVLAEPDGFSIIQPGNPQLEAKGSRVGPEEGESARAIEGVISSGTAGLRVDTGTYKAVYFSFGFEGINSAGDRALVMDRVLAWLQGVLARPLQISPADGGSLSAGEMTFTWNSVPGATGYQIQIDAVESFDSSDLIDSAGAATDYTVTLPSGTWYWRVRALPDGEFTLAWSVAVAAEGTLNLTAELQGRSDDSGAAFKAWSGGEQAGTCTSGGDGSCAILLSAGTYSVTAEMMYYLDSVWDSVSLSAGEIVALPTVKLLGGDVNVDCEINILDLTRCGSRFGTECGDENWDPACDINGDCVLNILDLTIIGGNFNLSCPSPWSATGRSEPEDRGMAQVRLEPSGMTLSPGETDIMTITVTGAAGMYGAEAHLTFDPEVVEVVDVDPEKDGVQVALGDLLEDPFVAVNQAYNVTGTINLALTQLAPTPPSDGDGWLAFITFRAVQIGTSPISLSDVILADPDGAAIASDVHGGTVLVGDYAYVYLPLVVR